MRGASLATSQMVTASRLPRIATSSNHRARSLRTRRPPGIGSEEGATFDPGTGRLERMRRGEDGSVGVTAAHDLQADGQSGLAETHGHARRGLTGEVERI